MKKLFITTIIIILLFSLFPFRSYVRAETNSLSWNTITSRAEGFIANGYEREKIDASNLINGAANILTTIGVIIVLVGLCVWLLY